MSTPDSAIAPPEPETGVLWVSGEIDLSSADTLKADGLRLVEQAQSVPVVLDLADVTFLDSTGIGALVMIRNAALAREVTVQLRGVPPRVERVLEITGLRDVFAMIAPSDTGRC